MASVRVFGLSLVLLGAVAVAPAEERKQPTAAELQQVLRQGESSDKYRQQAMETTRSKGYDLSKSPRRYDTDFAKRAFERLALRDRKSKEPTEGRPREGRPVDFEPALSGAQMLMWVLLFAGVAAALYFVFRNADWSRKNKGELSDALMSEKEARYAPEHWLKLADQLEAEGRYREAVRALYLSGMVTLDRRKILQLRPWETNWEHLRRFESGPLQVPVALAEVTREFDDIWYGNRVSGMPEVANFRQFARSTAEVPIA